MRSSRRFPNLIAQTQEISVKTFENTSPVNSTHSVDRTTGELRTSLVCFFGCWNILLSIVAKIFSSFPDRWKQRQLPPVKRSSLTHLWQTDFRWIFLTFKHIQICGSTIFPTILLELSLGLQQFRFFVVKNFQNVQTFEKSTGSGKLKD